MHHTVETKEARHNTRNNLDSLHEASDSVEESYARARKERDKSLVIDDIDAFLVEIK